MQLLRVATVAVVAIILILAADSADAAQKKKKKNKGITGAITAVDKSNDDVTLTLKAVSKKGGEARTVKITVKKDSKVEKQIGKKKDKQTAAAAVSDLAVGQNVIITTRAGQSDQAEKVVIGGKKKKKNNT